MCCQTQDKAETQFGPLLPPISQPLWYISVSSDLAAVLEQLNYSTVKLKRSQLFQLCILKYMT